MFTESNRYLIWSGRRYLVTQFGEVLDALGNKIEMTMENGHLTLELEWVLGKRKYLAALIILVAYEKLSMPDHLYDEVVPLYIDGSNQNLTPINLIYRFKNSPLEVEDIPGFYYIPLFTKYALSRYGVVINVESKKTLTWSITKGNKEKNQTGGYSHCRVSNLVGFSTMLFLHRAMCLVFKPYDHRVTKLVVNHKDGKPGNNTLDNLEFVTYQRNNEHARQTGLTKDTSMPILMKNLLTNEITRFESASACGKHFGNNRSGTMVLHRIRAPVSRVFEDMLVFKFDDGSPWPEIDQEKLTRLGSNGCSIAARNVFTGEVILFQGSLEGFKHTGVSRASILKHARDSEIVPIGGYNFRYKEEAFNWPEHTERELHIYRNHPFGARDGITVTDTKIGEELFFTNREKACKHFNITREYLWRCLNTNHLYKNRYLFKVFKLERKARSTSAAMLSV